jgi:ABC-2 type transport system permease protein
MSHSVVWRLIVKDLFFLRWFMIGSIAAGAGALAIMPQGRMASYVGAVSLICTFIVLLIFLVMGAVVQERKDKVMLFILSLPVSTTQYVFAKVISNAIAFGVPWIVLTIATFVVVDRTQIPNGVLPFYTALLGYFAFYYCALLGVALLADSNGWHGVAITVGNISVNFLIPYLLSRPSVKDNIEGPTAVWSSDIFTVLGIELVLAIVALGTAIYVRTRKLDFV